jgi:CrcB protein
MSLGRRLLLVLAGGMVGSAIRQAVLSDAVGLRPALLVINLAGALLAGWLVGAIPGHSHRARWQLPLAVVGVAGALTTFSALVVDALTLLDAGRVADAGTLITVSLLVGPAAALVGLRIGARS